MARQGRSVVWSPGATAQLDEAVHHIAIDSPSYALVFLERTLELANGLSTLSLRGRVVPEIGDRSVREVLVWSYRLIYEVKPRKVHILAFVHGARRLRLRGTSGRSEKE